MIYRDYHGTKTAALGFGGMRFESPHDHEKSVATVLRAHELGITYFDTATDYCESQSELIMGKAIVEMKKTGRPFTISTKSMKHKGDEVRAELERSLERLQVDCIDYYNCWYVLTLEDWESRKKNGAVEAIFKAKEEGLIKHAVFSTHLSGTDIRKVIEDSEFEGVTLGYSAINFPYRQEGIAAAAEKGLGVLTMNPLGGGLIPQNPKAFSFLKVRPEQSMLEASLHFLLSDERITAPLVGFRNIDDVETAVAAVESYTPYTEEEIAEIRRRVAEDLNSLCTNCMYCKGCPEDIKVWAFMESWNHLKLSGGANVSGRLKYHWGVSMDDLERCTSCGQCVRACTQKIPILDRFEDLKTALKDAS